MKELIVITASKPIIFKWGTLNKYSLVSSVKSIFFLENVRIYPFCFQGTKYGSCNTIFTLMESINAG